MSDRLPARIRAWYTERARFLGPGLILAMSSAGWVGILVFLSIGANMGYALLWAIAGVLLYKYMFTTGIARYTVSQGENIYAGLQRVPGLRNWEVLFIGAVYVVEIVYHAGGALVAANLLAGLVPIRLPVQYVVIAIFVLITLILFRNSYPLFKRIMVGAGFVIIAGMCVNFLSLYLSPGEMAAGLFFPAFGNEDHLYYAGVIMCSLGTGLSLLCSSMWLSKQIGDNHGEIFFKDHMKSVYFDLRLGFVILAVLSVFYLTIGFVVLNEHGLPAFEQDLMVQVIGHTMDVVPFGMTIFVAISFLTLFVYLIGATDGRARAVAWIIRQTVPTRVSEDWLYRCVVVLFSLIFIGFAYFGTKYTIKDVLTVSVFMFGLVGFMLVWLDRRLPAYARGSRLWYGIMLIGSTLFPVGAVFYAMM
ncbi:MAG TPA: divalent metal cation transporter [Methanoregulaceae archaeon]|nr:divalent metal cation transporter [Methanoregulaceae archaeon]